MHGRVESKKYQEEFEDCMDKLRLMENYIVVEQGSPNLLKKIRGIKSAFSYFRVDNPENKPSSINEAIFKQELIEVQLSINTLTDVEKLELRGVISSLQSKKSTENKNYQWIKECFEELRGEQSQRKTFISFLKDFANHISKIWKNKEASNSPIFFKPSTPVWTRKEENKALEDKLKDKDSKSMSPEDRKNVIQELKEKSHLQPRKR